LTYLRFFLIFDSPQSAFLSIYIKGTDHGLRLSVRDDGIGFDAAERKRKTGLGISSMRERVRIIQGEIRIHSEPEKGTTIDVNVPLKEKGIQHGKDLNGGDDLHEENA
jgi:signal transduction histidine kinase